MPDNTAVTNDVNLVMTFNRVLFSPSGQFGITWREPKNSVGLDCDSSRSTHTKMKGTRGRGGKLIAVEICLFLASPISKDKDFIRGR